MIRKTEEKINEHKIKVTTYLKGETKLKFICECLKTGENEAELARKIINKYYSKDNLNSSKTY